MRQTKAPRAFEVEYTDQRSWDRQDVSQYLLRPIATSGGCSAADLDKAFADNELVIESWSPDQLRAKLMALSWTNGRQPVEAKQFWEDSQRSGYLPRLRSRTEPEIAAEFDQGVADGTKRSVSENTSSLGFMTREWE